jgi:L-ascorbate metabolism protein UlaG (beta-lactamase superfamily)
VPDVTWWGHATVTIADRDVRVLTDPVFTCRLGHLRRRRGPRPGRDARRADLVLVSHLHADHLHLPSLAQVEPSAPVVLPAGAVRAVPALARLGRELVELAPGEETGVGGVRVTAVPAHHDGRRWPWSRPRVQPLGYVVAGSARTWFAGDTDLFDGMADAAGRVDLALVPVGGWGPTLGPGHLDPVRAAEAVAAVRAAAAVPIHFGTLWPLGCERVRPDRFHRPGADFVAEVRRRSVATVVRELAPGGGASRTELAGPHP